MFIITSRNGTNHNLSYFPHFTMYEIPEVCAIEPVDALRCQKYENLKLLFFPGESTKKNVRSIRTIEHRTFSKTSNKL